MYIMDFVATVVEHWQNNNKTKLFGVLLGIIWGCCWVLFGVLLSNWGAAWYYLELCLILFGVVLGI